MEILKETIRSLLNNKMRTLLSMLGIIIGVLAVITTMALGEGTKQKFNDYVNKAGANFILIQTGYYNDSEGNFFTMSKPYTSEDIKKLQIMCPSMKSATPILEIGGIPEYKRKTSRSNVISVNPTYAEAISLKASSGRMLNENDEKDAKRVCVIGVETARELFGKENPVGKTINMTQSDEKNVQKFPVTIVGLLKKSDSRWIGDPNSSVIIPFKTGDIRLNNQPGTFNSILTLAKDPKSAEKLMYELNYVMYTKFKDQRKYSLFSLEQIRNENMKFLNILSLVLTAISAISLLVGGIGIMNIMLVSVTERTREIGIKKAIGASRARILLEFLIESIIITFLAGGIGILFGCGITSLMNMALSGNEMFSATISINSIIISFGVSSFIGLFFGLLPAVKASKKSPIEALRYQ